MSYINVIGEQLNQVVYKYLLEMGYKHAAFTFEAEAKLDCEEVLKKRIPPRYLTQLAEQALLLRYMEQHTDGEGTHICTAPLTLLDDHTCNFLEKNLLGKRELIRKTNIEIAKELKESILRIDHEDPLPTGPMQLADEKMQTPNMNRAKSSSNARPTKSIDELPRRTG